MNKGINNMKLTILSLNLRIWTKHVSPCDENFWLKRTCQQAALFDEYKPDIICVQERIWPVGQELLGLNDYKVFGGRNCRLPIYVKKSFLKTVYTEQLNITGGTGKENGHGCNTIYIHLNEDKSKWFYLQNTHLPSDINETAKIIQDGNDFDTNTLFCGDFNWSLPDFLWIVRNKTSVSPDKFKFIDKEPAGAPTFISYDNPDNQRDIDQFGYVKYLGGKDNPIKANCVILPERTSDHFPLLATFEI